MSDLQWPYDGDIVAYDPEEGQEFRVNPAPAVSGREDN